MIEQDERLNLCAIFERMQSNETIRSNPHNERNFKRNLDLFYIRRGVCRLDCASSTKKENDFRDSIVFAGSIRSQVVNQRIFVLDKKIEKINSFGLVLPEFIEASKEMATYLASSTGSVINSIIPKNILLDSEKLKFETKSVAHSRPHEKFVLQDDDTDRCVSYRSLIREEFAKGLSVFLCLPTIQDIKKHLKHYQGVSSNTPLSFMADCQKRNRGYLVKNYKRASPHFNHSNRLFLIRAKKRFRHDNSG